MARISTQSASAWRSRKHEPLRKFRWGIVWEAECDGLYLLIVQERDAPTCTVYEFDAHWEFDDERQRVLRFPGGEEPGVPAGVAPRPPPRSGSAVQPWPEAK